MTIKGLLLVSARVSSSPFSVIRALILDMDGVVWRGDQPLGDLPALFAKMRQHDLKVVMATNNATLTIQQYLDKFQRFGVTLEAWQIVNSPQATAEYLKMRFPQGGPVYVVGEDGLHEALTAQGFIAMGTTAAIPANAGSSAGGIQAGPEQPLAVVVGMDRSVTYDRLSLASQFIRRGALFIGTNPDRTYPQPFGLVPGAGAILAAIEAATDTAPVIVGKPGPEMYRVAMARLGTQPFETLAVGDRIETDIAGGQALGCPTALVLSGVSSEAQARAWNPPPTLIAPDLAHVIDGLITQQAQLAGEQPIKGVAP